MSTFRFRSFKLVILLLALVGCLVMITQTSGAPLSINKSNWTQTSGDLPPAGGEALARRLQGVSASTLFMLGLIHPARVAVTAAPAIPFQKA